MNNGTNNSSNEGTVITTDSFNDSNDETNTITTTEVTTTDTTNNDGSTNVESPKTGDFMWAIYTFIGIAFITCIGIIVSAKKKEN